MADAARGRGAGTVAMATAPAAPWPLPYAYGYLSESEAPCAVPASCGTEDLLALSCLSASANDDRRQAEKSPLTTSPLKRSQRFTHGKQLRWKLVMAGQSGQVWVEKPSALCGVYSTQIYAAETRNEFGFTLIFPSLAFPTASDVPEPIKGVRGVCSARRWKIFLLSPTATEAC
ncbi:hypothetical protein AOLI_G00156200 [Acnodon oligacanthus]